MTSRSQPASGGARRRTLEHVRTLRARATTPPNAVRGRERIAVSVVGLVHAIGIGAGLAVLDHPMLATGADPLPFVGLAAVGVVVAWHLWVFGAVSPAIVVGTALGVALVGDLLAPPSVVAFEGETIVVGTSTLAAYANAWPALLTVGALLGVAERLLVAESLSRRWSLPLSQYRALAIGGFVGTIHAVAVFALVETPPEALSGGVPGFVGVGAFVTGLLASYAFLRWRYLLAPGIALGTFLVVGVRAAWPTPGDAALGYAYVQPLVIVGILAVVALERGWRVLQARLD
ncbi:hypothetical protein CV102_03680 [Natronococcus pandeyae]|uniref:Uncharacterized protein n=1 Tax=Natronococcus pandeyae TaxID=2055836 RepID=A0A8J8TTU9_9EURY|nr:hypothetical protein [Natronococcus pandeyae]TYL40675.1 hypothetical protein CV102_03680 [Natronococcus pandeyae]